jgi:uncharacterized protein (TIGR02246 family)
MKPLIAMCTGLAVVSCGAPSRDTQPERDALMATSRAWARAAEAGDVERMVSFWADDAILLPPDRPAVVGKDSIRAFVQQSFKIPHFRVTWEPEHARISEGGDIGYIVEHNELTFADSTGHVQTRFGKAVTVWRRDKTGPWLCIIETWNTNPTAYVLSPSAPTQ